MTLPPLSSATAYVSEPGFLPQDDIASHIRKLTKADAIAAANHVRRPANVAARNRSVHRQQAQEDRFKIVNCFRTLDDAAPAASPETAPSSSASAASEAETLVDTGKLTVVDIEKNDAPVALMAAVPPTTTPTTTTTATFQSAAGASDGDAEPQYVYDLYFPDAAAPNAHMDIFIEDLLRFVQGGNVYCRTVTMI